MSIELYEDSVSSGRPPEITCEYLNSAFSQHLSSRRYYVSIRSVTGWLKILRTTGYTDSHAKL